MTATDVARVDAPTTTLAIASDQNTWTEHQLATLRHLGVENATAGDLDVFFHQVKRTGLDPFARQIYMVGRDENRKVNGEWVTTTKYTIQTGIDGFRLIARRAADAAGDVLSFEDTLWCGQDGKWTDVWLRHDVPPLAAKVVVVRGHGQRYPAVATLAEYAGRKRDGSLTRMWQEKASLMLAKCAEALALRKAFPQDLSGLYTSDEMSAVDRPQVMQHQGAAVVSGEVGPDGEPSEPGLTAEQRAALDEAVNRVLAATDVDALRATWQALPKPALDEPVTVDTDVVALLHLDVPVTLGALLTATAKYVGEHGLSVDQALVLADTDPTPEPAADAAPAAA